MRTILVTVRDDFLLFIGIFCISRALAITMKIEQAQIELNKPLRISCEQSNGPIIGSRKWFGGKDLNLICFNGVSIDQTKYKEEILSSSKYQLTINDVTEEDIISPYVCNFGFLSAELIPDVIEHNFIKLPSQVQIQTEYSKNDDHYSISVKFQNVHPTPICTVEVEAQSKSLIKVKEEQNGLLYDVHFAAQSEEPYHLCDNPVNIECKFGKTNYPMYIPHDIDCNRISPDTIHMLVAIVIVSSIVVIGIIITVSKICLQRRERSRRMALETQSRLAKEDVITPLTKSLVTTTFHKETKIPALVGKYQV